MLAMVSGIRILSDLAYSLQTMSVQPVAIAKAGVKFEP